MKQVSCNSEGIALASNSFKNGGVIIFPTDTIYGIGCNPYDENAVNKIYSIKKRDRTKSLPVLGYSKEILEDIVYFNHTANIIIEKFWPGPLTIVLPLKDKKLTKLSNGADTLAVRIPNSKCALSILKECKLIVGTSANISGESPLTDPQKLDILSSDFDIFLNARIIKSSGESTIIEIKEEKIRILRNGAIPEEKFVEIL